MSNTTEQNLVSNFFKTIDIGRSGLNQGITTRLEGVDSIVDGITASTMTVLLGGTGSGKTTYALFYYIYEPLCQAIEEGADYHSLIFSLEMSADMLMAKLLSLRLYDQHKMIFTYKDIMSRKKPLNDADYSLFLRETEWLEAVAEHITIIDTSLTGKEIISHITTYMHSIGTYNSVTKSYKLTNPAKKITVLVDHVGLLSVSAGSNLKREIDDMSKGLVSLRNTYGISPVLVQQLNRSSNSMDRRKAGMQEIELQDAKDTGSTLQDADVVIGLYFPHREKVDSYLNYDIGQFKDRFRGWLCLKNRFGEVGAKVPLCFWGELGFFKSIEEESQDDVKNMKFYMSPKYNNPNYEWIDKPKKPEKGKYVFPEF